VTVGERDRSADECRITSFVARGVFEARLKSPLDDVGSIFDNPTAVCLTPSFVEHALQQAGFKTEETEVMLPGITMLTRATKPP